MRWGTLMASVLFIGGALLAWGGVASASSAVVIAGCAVLILLPFLRLILMLMDFARRADNPYVGVVILVIILILAAATTGISLSGGRAFAVALQASVGVVPGGSAWCSRPVL
jgi:uncharacterized membrane protein